MNFSLNRNAFRFFILLSVIGISGTVQSEPTICHDNGSPYDLDQAKQVENILSNLNPKIPDLGFCIQHGEIQIEVSNLGYHASTSDARPHITFRVGVCDTRPIEYRTLHVYADTTWVGYPTPADGKHPCE